MRGIENKFLVGVLLALTAGGAFAQRIPLTQIQQITANRVLGNASASTANITQQTMPSCSTAGSALNWTTNTGFGCNTSITANGISGSGSIVTSSTGPYAFGGGTNTSQQFLFEGNFTPNAATAVGVEFAMAQLPLVNQSAYGVEIQPTLVRFGSGTMPEYASLHVTAPAVGGSSTTIPTMSTVLIEGAPGNGGTNWALNVKAGNVNTAGTIFASGLTAAGGTPSSVCMNAATKEITVNAALTCTVSSARFKNTIAPLDVPALELVAKIEPDTFYYNDRPDRPRIGLVAENLAAVDPRLSEWDAQGRPNSIDFPAMFGLLTRAMQEQQAQINALKREVGELRSMQYAIGRAFKRASFR